ncbi:type IV secretion system DNA-binding domain-containing protein [bacterium]|jgi:CxxC-x17-CxxC domain-containing protein|nr:type IV secretion system DNA-binding domain-containing protein [bacterium]
MENKEIVFFGQTTFRGEKRRFGIRTDDRRRHIYVVGKTGMGKTELLKNMVIQDIRNGKGVGFIDPHGEASEEILKFIPEERIKDVVYFNPSDIDCPIAFNIMEDVDAQYRHLIAGGMMGVFKKIWPDVWSSRMEYILNNAILALLETPGSTLLGINRLLADPEWRNSILENVKDSVVKAFWLKEFSRYSQKYEIEATAAIQNKIGQFISSPLIRNIIGQEKSTIDIRKIMDEKKILIMNLSKGRVGEDSSRLLGALLVTKLQLAAMSRVDIPEKDRNDFILYIDEFQNFSTDSFANILSEARKYRLSLVLAHQYINQMEEKVRDAVFGNVGTMITFRVGAEDGEFLEKEFSPEFIAHDLVNLPKQNIYVKLMIDGLTSRPFSAETLVPAVSDYDFEKEIIEFSRTKYGTERKGVEEKIAKYAGVENMPKMEIKSVNRTSSAELFDAECGKCGKKVKVPFKPDGKRPVYCKACLGKNGSSNNAPTNVVSHEEKPKTSFEKLPYISLEDTSKDFVPAKKEKRVEKVAKPENVDTGKIKKKIDILGLREVIKEAKKEKIEEKKEIKETGIINPGEIIKF